MKPVDKSKEQDWTEVRVDSMADVGNLIHRVRKGQELTQEDVSGLASLGTRFLSELERGKPTVQMDKVLKVLALLGIDVVLRSKDMRAEDLPLYFWMSRSKD